MLAVVWGLGVASGLFGLWAMGYGVYQWWMVTGTAPFAVFSCGFLGLIASLEFFRELGRLEPE